MPEAEPSLSSRRDPNDPRELKAPQWPPYTAGAQQYVSLNLRPLEVRRGLRAQACAFWNRFLPKLLSATGTQGPAGRGWEDGGEKGRGEREGRSRPGVTPLFFPQPRRLPAPAQAPPTGRLPRGPGPASPYPSFSSSSSSSPGSRGCDHGLFPLRPQGAPPLRSGRTVGKGPPLRDLRPRAPSLLKPRLKLARDRGVTYDPSQGPTRLCYLNGNEKANFLFL